MKKDGRISEYAPISDDDTGVIHGWSVYGEDEIKNTGWLGFNLKWLRI